MMHKSVNRIVRKIAVLRTNQGLGDLIVCLPAFDALKRAYPEAEIVLLGLPWHQYFLQYRSVGIDRIIAVPPSLCLTAEHVPANGKTESEFLRDLAKENFDIFINLQAEEYLSSLLSNHSRSGLTVGQDMGDIRLYDRSIPFSYYQHEALRCLDLVGLVGAQPHRITPSLPLLDNEVIQAHDTLYQQHVRDTFVVLHPGATDMRRRWSTTNFALLADHLILMGYDVLLLGNEADGPIIDEVTDNMHYRPVSIYTNLTLGMMAGIQRHSHLVISNDTGPLHLARAVGCASIGLYWAPNIINWGSLKQDRHAQAIAWELRCPGCGIIPNNPYPFEPQNDHCKHLFPFIDSISVDEVLALTKMLLARKPSPA